MHITPPPDLPAERQNLPEPAPMSSAGEGAEFETQRMTPEQRRTLIGVILVVLLLIGLTVLSIVFLMKQEIGEVARIRDIFIIFMAVQSLLIGFALVILMIQLARLINLLQNEIKPILDSTNETVSNLRGTTVFLSDNLVGPVIKLNEYMAGFVQLLSVLGLMRKPPKK